jgi:hypothetical protein
MVFRVLFLGVILGLGGLWPTSKGWSFDFTPPSIPDFSPPQIDVPVYRDGRFISRPEDFCEEIKITPNAKVAGNLTLPNAGPYKDTIIISLPQGKVYDKIISFLNWGGDYKGLLDLDKPIPTFKMNRSYKDTGFTIQWPAHFFEFLEDFRTQNSWNHFLLPCDPLSKKFTDALEITVSLVGSPTFAIRFQQGGAETGMKNFELGSGLQK